MSVSSTKDFVVYDMPKMLGRKVTRPSEIEPTKWVTDESWYESVRDKSYHLFMFFQNNGLLLRPVVSNPRDVDRVVLRLDDFTDEGKGFIMSQAPDKWLASFDRPGSRKQNSDVRYLEQKLKQLRSANR
jgi:hypothetical protein